MFALTAACCLGLSTSNLFAHVTFDWATIGNPGNAPDQVYYQLPGYGFQLGAVANTYLISKHEVTNFQYAEFLNAVAASDPNDLFSEHMDITRSGSSGFFTYAVNAGFGRNPVNFVSFYDAMRFVNWLENGQGTGSTESGVYTISDGVSEIRAEGATFFIPNEDEWYKAAYYDPRSAAAGGPPGDDNYWLYPTQSDTAPTAEVPRGGTNSANCDNAVGDTTDVGAYVATTGFYGTFDQGGNVGEWNEAIIREPLSDPPFSAYARGMRGGSWASSSVVDLASSRRLLLAFPGSGSRHNGFRVARIPEPTTGLLGLLATVGLLVWRRP
jgi:formylglycine-generating enzyme required for sulfatase activity